MSQATGSIRGLMAQREREFLTGTTRVKMNSSVENLEVGDFTIAKLESGETAELPRWVAEELVASKLADDVEPPFEAEMFRALSKEKMMGPLQLSTLPEDFYPRMKRRLSFLGAALSEGRVKKEDLESFRAGGYDLIGIRLSKLLALSSSASQGSSLAERLTPEEETFFTVSQSLSREWRAALLGSAT